MCLYQSFEFIMRHHGRALATGLRIGIIRWERSPGRGGGDADANKGGGGVAE